MNASTPIIDLFPGLANVPDGRAPHDDDSRLTQELLRCERAVARGEFATMGCFYDSIPKDSPYLVWAASVALIGAVGTGDVALFDLVRDDVRTYPQRVATEEAALAVEIWDVWMRQVLRIEGDWPKWLEECDLQKIPAVWRPWALIFGATHLAVRGELVAARTLASVLLSHGHGTVSFGSLTDIELKLILAAAYRDEGAMEKAAKWCREAVLSAKVHDYALPFLTLPQGPKSALGLAIQELAPEFQPTIRRLALPYFRNVVRFHNRATGGAVTDLLTPREFYVAESLVRGLRYKEIAERLGIAYCRVNELVTILHEKLDVRSSAELKPFIW